MDLNNSYETPPLPRVVKNDGPTRFWSYVDMYCGDISEDHVKALTEISETLLSPVEKLTQKGEHFSKQWPMQDLKQEQMQGSRSFDRFEGLSEEEVSEYNDAERIIQLGEKKCKEMCNSEYAGVSQRIVSSLIEENLMTSPEEAMADACEDEESGLKSTSSQPAQPTNEDELEKRLRLEFKQIDSMRHSQPDEDSTSSPPDQVSRELELLQMQLEPLQQLLGLKVRALLKLTQQGRRYQDLRRKLRHKHVRIHEMYRSVTSSNWNGRRISRKTEEQVAKLLAEKEQIEEELYEAMKVFQ